MADHIRRALQTWIWHMPRWLDFVPNAGYRAVCRMAGHAAMASAFGQDWCQWCQKATPNSEDKEARG